MYGGRGARDGLVVAVRMGVRVYVRRKKGFSEAQWTLLGAAGSPFPWPVNGTSLTRIDSAGRLANPHEPHHATFTPHNVEGWDCCICLPMGGQGFTATKQMTAFHSVPRSLALLCLCSPPFLRKWTQWMLSQCFSTAYCHHYYASVMLFEQAWKMHLSKRGACIPINADVHIPNNFYPNIRNDMLWLKSKTDIYSGLACLKIIHTRNPSVFNFQWHHRHTEVPFDWTCEMALVPELHPRIPFFYYPLCLTKHWMNTEANSKFPLSSSFLARSRVIDARWRLVAGQNE